MNQHLIMGSLKGYGNGVIDISSDRPTYQVPCVPPRTAGKHHVILLHTDDSVQSSAFLSKSTVRVVRLV